MKLSVSSTASQPSSARAGHFDRWALLCTLPAALLLLVLFVLPMLLLLRVSLFEGGGQSGFGVGAGGFYRPGTWSLQAYGTLLGDFYFREVLGFTLALGAALATLSVLIAYPLALFIWRLSGKRKWLALGAVVLPKIANLLVVIYGWVLILSNEGPINHTLLRLGLIRQPLELLHNLAGVLIGETYLILPYAVLVLVAAFERIDPTLEAAARGLGASRWQTFRRVTLPLSARGVVLAGMISLIWGLGAFISPYLLGGPEQITLAVDVQKQAFENLNWPRAAADAVLMLVVVTLVVAVFGFTSRARRTGAVA
jgi:ABC-type spermidine/putrescine transport system permease subunit I